MEQSNPSSGRGAYLIAAAAIVLAVMALGVQFRAQPEQTLSREQVEAIVEEKLAERVPEEPVADADLDQRIEEGIVAFIQKQRDEEQDRPRRMAQNVPPPNLESDHVFGNPQAEITLIEYSDFECPFCKRFHNTPKRIVEHFDGKVNWVYRHFPLSFHNPGAQKQAEASECVAELAGNDAFWVFSDAIYERTKSGGKGFPLNQLKPLAEEVGVDGAAFEECYNSGKYAAKVQQDMQEGAKAGISGTPGNILYHNATGLALPIQGAQPYENVRAAVEALIQEAAEADNANDS